MKVKQVVISGTFSVHMDGTSSTQIESSAKPPIISIHFNIDHSNQHIS